MVSHLHIVNISPDSICMKIAGQIWLHKGQYMRASDSNSTSILSLKWSNGKQLHLKFLTAFGILDKNGPNETNGCAAF